MRRPVAGKISWTPAIKRCLSLCLAVTLLALTGLPVGEAWAEAAPGQDKPAEAGLPLVQRQCEACHNLRKLLHYQKSREQWAQTIARMMDNNGVTLTAPEKNALLDYLAKAAHTP